MSTDSLQDRLTAAEARIVRLQILMRRLAKVLPRPWMGGGVTWQEWEGALAEMDAELAVAVDGRPVEPGTGALPGQTVVEAPGGAGRPSTAAPEPDWRDMHRSKE